MLKIKNIIENSESKLGRYFDLFIQFLILVSLVTFSIETLPDNSAKTIFWLDITEIVCVIIFSIEYILRLIVSDSRLKFILSFYGLIDLIAILPFYLSTGVDLRSLRALRLVRIFRAFKLLRYNHAMKRLKDALVLAKEEFILFFFVSGILLFFSAAGIYYFENQAQPEVYSSIFESLWWAVCTLTTVGYGDIYPITIGGEIFTFIILMIGLGIISVPAGIISSAITHIRKKENE